MNFSCPACQAKYFVRDEDVIGRTLKLTCRRCKGEIPIQGRRRSDPTPGPPRSISSDRIRLALPLELTGARAVAEMSETGPSSVPPSVRPSLPPPLPADVGLDEFYLGIAGAPVGPLLLEEVVLRIQRGDVGPRTYVWRPGLSAWQRMTQVPELASFLPRLSLTPPPALPGTSSSSPTLEERLGFGYLGESPPSSRPAAAASQRRVRLSPPQSQPSKHSEWTSLWVGLVLSLAVGMALGALL